jgi:Zn-dependent peptidase ImmA (M78 family)
MPEISPFIKPHEMERRSLEVLRKLGINDPPIDPIMVAKNEGIGVFYAKFEDDKVSGVLRTSDGQWEILVNDFDPPKRQRFTIAHELGHYFLHKDQIDDEFVDTEVEIFRSGEMNAGGPKDRREVQANMFAASLLMPRSMVLDAMLDTEDLGDLSQIFFVSRAAIGNRVSDVIDIDA